jgi:hypothetical protein
MRLSPHVERTIFAASHRCSDSGAVHVMGRVRRWEVIPDWLKSA